MAGTVSARLEASAWTRFLDGVWAKVKEPARLLRAAMATRGYRDILEHFEEERGPDGPWPSRAVSTQRYYAQINAGLIDPPPGTARAAFNPSNKLLQLTGALRKTLIPARLRANTQDVGVNQIMVLSPLGYSGQHDEGDPVRGLPRREFMWLSDRAQDDMAKIIANLVIEGAA